MGEDKKCPCDAMLETQQRLQRHEERLADGTTSFALINQSLESIQGDLEEVKNDVKEIMGKPAHRWDKITEYVLLAAIAFLLARAGLA